MWTNKNKIDPPEVEANTRIEKDKENNKKKIARYVLLYNLIFVKFLNEYIYRSSDNIIQNLSQNNFNSSTIKSSRISNTSSYNQIPIETIKVNLNYQSPYKSNPQYSHHYNKKNLRNHLFSTSCLSLNEKENETSSTLVRYGISNYCNCFFFNLWLSRINKHRPYSTAFYNFYFVQTETPKPVFRK